MSIIWKHKAGLRPYDEAKDFPIKWASGEIIDDERIFYHEERYDKKNRIVAWAVDDDEPVAVIVEETNFGKFVFRELPHYKQTGSYFDTREEAEKFGKDYLTTKKKQVS